jgi:hypothetical protein
VRPTLFLLLTSLAAAAPKPGDDGTPEFDKAAALVKQLGHPRFPVREAAAKQLLEMGGSAVAALQAGTKADDEEVRTRCKALLPQAKAAEWRRRAEAYLADTEGKQKHDMPLLAEWEKLVGKPDAGSRKLFADMVSNGGDLLDVAAADPKTATAKVASRAKEVFDRVTTAKGQVKAEPGELAAVLFADYVSAGSGPVLNFRRGRRDRPASPAQLLANPAWAEALDAKDTGPALRKLLARWMGTRPVTDFTAYQQFALLAQKKPFAEAAPILAAAAKSKDADLLSIRLLAVQALGKVGGPEATATLTDLLSDTSVIFGGMDEHRLGDSALAALVKMSGKKLGDYGLNNNMGIGFASGPGEEAVMLEIHGFQNAADRTKALQKWKDEAGKNDPPTKKDQ